MSITDRIVDAAFWFADRCEDFAAWAEDRFWPYEDEPVAAHDDPEEDLSGIDHWWCSLHHREPDANGEYELDYPGYKRQSLNCSDMRIKLEPGEAPTLVNTRRVMFPETPVGLIVRAFCLRRTRTGAGGITNVGTVAMNEPLRPGACPAFGVGNLTGGMIDDAEGRINVSRIGLS